MTINPSSLFYPSDYKVIYFNLVAQNKSPLDITNLIVELSYFEDLFSFSVTGYVVLRDAAGVIEVKNMLGNEYFEANFGKSTEELNNISGKYRIYKIESIEPASNFTSQVYKIYFCSEELILSEQNKVCKSFRGKKISEMINYILTDKTPTGKLQIQNNKVFVEDTHGMYDLIVPLLKPFEAISWLSSFALSAAFQKSADMLFFQNKSGFYFRSIQSLFKQTPYNTYKYELVNLPDETLQQKLNKIIRYEIVKPFDVITNINSGVYASKTIAIDTLSTKANTTEMNFAKSGRALLNDVDVSKPLSNRLGYTQDQSFDGCLKVVMANPDHLSNSYLSTVPTADKKDIYASVFVPSRTIDISSLEHTRIKIVVPGDSNLKVGLVVNIVIPKVQENDKSPNPLYSGKYLITAVRHSIVTPEYYQTLLELSKDSYAT
jgi:hypothetical protein